MIEVRRPAGHGRCSSLVCDDAPDAVLDVTIGASGESLCAECARDLLNALGFMLADVTGESIAQLVGLKKRGGK